MDRSSPFSRRALLQSLCGTTVVALSGCGTLMYPERRGQGRTGGIDWTVAGMDAIGLIFFFVPGVLAFAVDYYNGTLFFPSNSQSAASDSHRTSRHRTLQPVSLNSARPSWVEIAAVIESQTGKRVAQLQDHCITRHMKQLSDFWDTEKLVAGEINQTAITRCQSPDSH